MDNIKIKQLNIKEDHRGWVAEILRAEELSNQKKGFGQFYVTTAKKGQTKGKHYHNRKTEYFCVVAGKGLLTLVDKTTKAKMEIEMGEGNMVMVTILPKIWHAISNTADTDMFLIAYIDEPFNPDDPDTIYEETP